MFLRKTNQLQINIPHISISFNSYWLGQYQYRVLWSPQYQYQTTRICCCTPKLASLILQWRNRNYNGDTYKYLLSFTPPDCSSLLYVIAWPLLWRIDEHHLWIHWVSLSFLGHINYSWLMWLQFWLRGDHSYEWRNWRHKRYYNINRHLTGISLLCGAIWCVH